MRLIVLLVLWQFGLLAGGRLFADVVTLKDGRQISGSVESGNTQELHIKVGDQSQTIDVHQIQAIQFGVSLPAPAPPKAAALSPEPAAPTVKAAAPAPDTRRPPTSAPPGTITPGAGPEIAAKVGGKGVGPVPESRITNTLTQPAFANSDGGRQ